MTISADALFALPYAYDSPFELSLADGTVFYANEVIRLIPKKRVVVFGEWQGKKVVAKLFFARKRANQQMIKEREGVQLLSENNIPTAQLYYHGWSVDKRIAVLIFERILQSKNLEASWREQNDINAFFPILKNVVIELATQHVLGILQEDLHFKNFLLTDKIIYTLDAAAIKRFPPILSKKISMESVALFLSQLGAGMEEQQEKLFLCYAKARGWILKKDDIAELFLLIKQYDKERWRKFSKKIFRNSSNFACLHHAGIRGMYDRAYTGSEFMQFLQDPDSVFYKEETHVLKAGRSATVIKVRLDQYDVVVKRYNMKNFWHRLRRTLRYTRAWTCWRLAQKLKLFHVATANPIAFIEYQWAGLRGTSYYITEYIPYEHLGEYVTHHQQQPEKMTAIARRIASLLKNLAALKITHGDLKVTNLLLREHQYPVLIDLDGAKEHSASYSLGMAWKKEIKRFLANFKNMPLVLKLFKQELL